MDKRIADLLKKYNIRVVFADTHQKGFFIEGIDGKPSIIAVNSQLDNKEIDKTILHEIGHHLNDKYVLGDYKKDGNTRTCSEHGANTFMISEQIKHYIALGNDALTANWLDLAESIGTEDYLQVREELKKYLLKNDDLDI